MGTVSAFFDGGADCRWSWSGVNIIFRKAFCTVDGESEIFLFVPLCDCVYCHASADYFRLEWTAGVNCIDFCRNDCAIDQCFEKQCDGLFTCARDIVVFIVESLPYASDSTKKNEVFLNERLFLRSMKGVIAAFRGSHKTRRGNQLIVYPDSVKSKKEAVALEGKKVVWNNPEGKKKVTISGYVSKAHGGKGALRVVFEKGLPGQSLGTKVEIE